MNTIRWSSLPLKTCNFHLRLVESNSLKWKFGTVRLLPTWEKASLIHDGSFFINISRTAQQKMNTTTWSSPPSTVCNFDARIVLSRPLHLEWVPTDYYIQICHHNENMKTTRTTVIISPRCKIISLAAKIVCILYRPCYLRTIIEVSYSRHMKKWVSVSFSRPAPIPNKIWIIKILQEQQRKTPMYKILILI